MNQKKLKKLHQWGHDNEGIPQNFKEADKCLRESAEKDLAYAACYGNFLYYTLGNYDGAIKYYQQAMEAFPNSDVHKDYDDLIADIKFMKFDRTLKRHQRVFESRPHTLNRLNYTETSITCHLIEQAKVLLKPIDDGKVSAGQKELLIAHLFHYILDYEKRDMYADQINSLLSEGVAYPQWQFKHLLTSNYVQNDPDYEKIKVFTQKITGKY
jgi:tetratricopeptide (TPR) repeat protein